MGNRLFITNFYISVISHAKELFNEHVRGLNRTQPEHYSLLVNHKFSVAGQTGSEFSVHRVWRDDAEFARQFLTGVHPGMCAWFGCGCCRCVIAEVCFCSVLHSVWIRVCTAIPSIFRPSNATLARMLELTDGATLEQLMAAKRLFLADYEILDGTDMVEGRFFYAPVVLLFLKHK